MADSSKISAALKGWLREDRIALGLLAFAAALQLVVGLRLFAPGELAGDDMSIHLAEIAGISRGLAVGELDLWNPSANGGFASGYFYQFLPQLACAVAHLLLGWLLSLSTIFKLSVLAALVALPFTVSRAFRVIGASPAVAASAGLGASTVLAGSGWGAGIDSLFSTGLYTQAFALVFYPLALAYAARTLLEGKHFGRAILYTLVCGFCHPFIAFATALPLLFLPWWRIGIKKATARGAALFAAALAGSAPLWLPIIVDYDAFGGFPARVAGEDGIGPSTFFPEFFRGAYFDVSRRAVTTALIVLGFPIAFLRRGRLLLPIFLAGFAFIALIVLGPSIGKTEGDLLPAVRFLAPMQIFLGAAAWAAATVGIIELVGFFRPRLPRATPLVAALLAIVFAAGLTQLAVGVARRGKQRVKTVYSFKRIKRAELGKIIAFLATQPPGRVFAASELGSGSHWWMYLPYVYADRPAVRAYGGAALQSSPNYVFLRSADLFKHHAVWGTRYLIAREKHASSERFAKRFAELDANIIYDSGGYRIYELADTSLFRAVGVAGRLEGSRKEKTATIAKWMQSEAASADLAWIEGAPPTDVAPPTAVTFSETRHSRRAHGATLEVAGDAPALVRLAVSFHPGWRATLDGELVAVRRVSPAFVAVLVPPGAHEIRFEFVRPAWTWLLYLLLLAVIVAAFVRAKRRRPRAPRAAMIAKGGARFTGALVVALVVAGPSRPAAAQADAFPRPVDAAFGRGGAAIVATSNGLLVRKHRDAPFTFVCAGASGSKPGAFAPRVAIRDDGTFVATSYRGIRESRDGCGFELSHVADRQPERGDLWFSSVAAAPGGALFAATADSHNDNDVYRSAGSGEPLVSVGLRSSQTWYVSVATSPSGAHVYASGYSVAGKRGEGGGARGLFLVDGEIAKARSLKAGRSGRLRIALVASESEIYVVAEGAVEPRGDRLFHSTDGAASFRAVLETAGPIVGVARDKTGATWLASEGALYLAPQGSSEFASLSGPPLSCLVADELGEIIGCRSDTVSSGVLLSRMADDGDAVTVTSVLRALEIAAPCGEAARDCEASWPRFCSLVGAECVEPEPVLTKSEAPPAIASSPAPRNTRRLFLLVALLIAFAAFPLALSRAR